MGEDRPVEDHLEEIIQESKSIQEKIFNETILSLYKEGLISARYNKEISDWEFKLTEDGNKAILLNTAKMFDPVEA